MTHDDRLQQRLVDWMDASGPSSERTEAVRAAMAVAMGVRQRPGWLVRDGLGSMGGIGVRRPLVLMLILGLTLAAAAAMGVGALLGTRPTEPTPPLGWPSLGLRATGSLVIPRACHSAVLLDDGRVLVVGGRAVDGSVITTPEIYDPRSSTFRAIEGATAAGDGASATLLADGRVLIAGGRGVLPSLEEHSFCRRYSDTIDGAAQLGAAFLFDPSTEQIEPTGALRTPRSAISRRSSVTDECSSPAATARTSTVSTAACSRPSCSIRGPGRSRRPDK